MGMPTIRETIARLSSREQAIACILLQAGQRRRVVPTTESGGGYPVEEAITVLLRLRADGYLTTEYEPSGALIDTTGIGGYGQFTLTPAGQELRDRLCPPT